ncbi:MAG: hypothetical protein WCE79_21470, partial [Xanthobacteraceae bacterium]
MLARILTRIREVYDWAERAHFWPTVWGAIKEAYGWITGGGLVMTVAAALAGWSYFAIFCAGLLGLAIVMLSVITLRVLHLSKGTAIPAASSTQTTVADLQRGEWRIALPPSPEPDLNASEAFNFAISESKRAQHLTAHPNEMPEGMY